MRGKCIISFKTTVNLVNDNDISNKITGFGPFCIVTTALEGLRNLPKSSLWIFLPEGKDSDT
jgi:hypothetical protein